MKIAISQRTIINKNGDQADSLEQSYIKYFQNFGVTLIIIPNILENIPLYLRDLDIERIILSGGDDVDPKFFSGKTSDQGSYSPQRDHTEAEILKFAINNKIPVLGVCRGMQFLNVFFGGTLIQNLKQEFPNIQTHVAVNHQIELIDSKIIKYFPSKMFNVNSYHNCGISLKELSLKLKAFAKDKDNLIEGIYHPGLPAAGIMWHPERKSPNQKFNFSLIKAFLKKELYWKI